ncbi:MAG: LPXTG cell wall anchor domain-containing protein [Acidimicrobiales bacterium]|jgi:LPXTG-motif cell wall-anchored protein
MTGTSCSTSVTPPSHPGTPAATSQLPETGSPASSVTPPATAPTTSLPFTGADVEGMAVVGVGAVLAGSLLMRRRRRPLTA